MLPADPFLQRRRAFSRKHPWWWDWLHSV